MGVPGARGNNAVVVLACANHRRDLGGTPSPLSPVPPWIACGAAEARRTIDERVGCVRRRVELHAEPAPRRTAACVVSSCSSLSSPPACWCPRAFWGVRIDPAGGTALSREPLPLPLHAARARRDMPLAGVFDGFVAAPSFRQRDTKAKGEIPFFFFPKHLIVF